MNKIRLSSTLLVIIFLMKMTYAEHSGMAFLSMPTSASTAATMGVFASEPTNAMVLFESPIGIMTENTNINFTNNFWFADINQSVLTLGKATRYGNFGAGVNFVKSPGIEVRTRPSDEPEGEIEAQYLAAALGYSREVISNIFIGLNTKYLYQSLYTETASGFAMDAAALWQMPGNMNFTVAIKDFGKMNQLKDESTTLPTRLQFGIVRPQIFDKTRSFNGSLGIYFDHNLIAERTEINVGGEFSVYEKFYLRGGYSIQKDYNNSSFGLGLNISKIRFDFAVLMIEEIPDYPYVFTFSYNL